MKWQFDPADVVPLALGAAVLGTGGGGDPYVGQLTLQRIVLAALLILLGRIETPIRKAVARSRERSKA